jgi:hypothetical protein
VGEKDVVQLRKLDAVEYGIKPHLLKVVRLEQRLADMKAVVRAEEAKLKQAEDALKRKMEVFRDDNVCIETEIDGNPLRVEWGYDNYGDRRFTVKRHWLKKDG